MRNNCTTCRPNFEIVSGECKPKCVAGSFFDLTTGHCSICNRQCLSCDGPSPYNCTACTTGYALISNTFQTDASDNLTVTGYCKRVCDTGFYNIGEYPNECRPCSVNCLNCDESGKVACLICSPDYYLDTGRCLPCHPFCKTCIGSSPWNCLTCGLGLTLAGDGFCGKNDCSTGTVFSLATQTCIICHQSCDLCFDSTENGC